MKRLVVAIALLLAAFAPCSAMTNDAATVLRLVKATPQLAIDASIPAPGGNDKKTHPYVRTGNSPDTLGGNIDYEAASMGRLSDGTQVMVIPLESGGSGGVFTQIVFVQPFGEAAKYAGAIPSGAGHLAVNVTFHGIVAIQPLYGPNDKNCCPTRFLTRTYTIQAHRLHLVSERTSAKP
jgi:hypothetical protein